MATEEDIDKALEWNRQAVDDAREISLRTAAAQERIADALERLCVLAEQANKEEV